MLPTRRRPSVIKSAPKRLELALDAGHWLYPWHVNEGVKMAEGHSSEWANRHLQTKKTAPNERIFFHLSFVQRNERKYLLHLKIALTCCNRLPRLFYARRIVRTRLLAALLTYIQHIFYSYTAELSPAGVSTSFFPLQYAMWAFNGLGKSITRTVADTLKK